MKPTNLNPPGSHAAAVVRGWTKTKRNAGEMLVRDGGIVEVLANEMLFDGLTVTDDGDGTAIISGSGTSHGHVAEDLTTAETDTTLVLSPDGAGGVEFRAEAGAIYGTPALTLGTANAAGSTDEVIRRDATILAFDATAPVTQAYSDTAAAGTATVAARRDHKHGMPASGGGGGGFTPYHNDATNATTQTISSGATNDLVSLTDTFVSGAIYYVTAEVYVNTAAAGKLFIRDAAGNDLGGNYGRDARNTGLFVFHAYYTGTGSSETLKVSWGRESGTAVFGLSNDPRWARNIRVLRIA